MYLIILLSPEFSGTVYTNEKHWVIDEKWKLLSCVQRFATPWIAAHQASLSITNSRSLPKLMSIESVMPSSHLILCCPFLLLSPIPPSIRVFSSESTLCMRWPKYWSFSFCISPSNEHPGLISFRMDWLDLLAESYPTPQFESINSSMLSFLHSPTLTSIHDYWKNYSLLSHEKEWSWVNSSEVAEPWTYYTEWSQKKKSKYHVLMLI